MFIPFSPSGNVGFVTLPKQDETVQEGAKVFGFGRLSVSAAQAPYDIVAAAAAIFRYIYEIKQ